MASLGQKSEAVTLTYFHGWGLAEQARWVLAAAGIEFQNVCLDTPEDLKALRDQGDLLFGQLPLLRIDGLRLVQSQAIVRYVAHKVGLSGATPAEAALVDMVAEAAKDCRGPVTGFPFASDKAAHLAQLPATFEKYFPKFEAALATSGSGHVLASGRLSYADVFLAELVEEYEVMQPGCSVPFPLLAANHATVTSLPPMKAYLASANRFPFPHGDLCTAYVANIQAVLR